MKRLIETDLIQWKDSPERLPLILRGARQVGKSYTAETFGQKYFSNILTINFEEKPYFCSCFESLEVDSIVKRLAHLSGQNIIPGETLLFLDEIQNCPSAIRALRYFKEKLPNLHVIAAGSFLEFVLEDEPIISFPVGRVQFMNMKPLSFMEFLDAIGQGGIKEILSSMSLLESSLAPDLHQHLLGFVREYYFVGGMPAAVVKFIQSHSYSALQHIHASILDAYRLDLAKYAKKNQYKNLHVLFEKIPELTGQHFKFSKIDPHASNPARDYKYALHKLELARVIQLVYRSDANGLPLKAEIDDKKFKTFFLDIGLLQYALEIDTSDRTSQLADIHRGVMAEQFVAQELLAYVDPYLDRHLFYWDRQREGGSSEVDFVVNMANQIIPIEVKAGSAGKLKSLLQFLTVKNSKIGVKISEAPLSLDRNILSVPFYLIHQLTRLIAQLPA